MKSRGPVAGQVRWLVRPHRVLLHAGVRVVGVWHDDVAVAVAKLGGGDGRGGGVLLGIQSSLVLIVFEASWRLLLRLGLAVVVVAAHYLTIAIVSSRGPGAGRFRVGLPLIHGCGGNEGHSRVQREASGGERSCGGRKPLASKGAGGESMRVPLVGSVGDGAAAGEGIKVRRWFFLTR